MRCKKGGTYELYFLSVLHKSRLLKKWSGGNFIYTKQDFLDHDKFLTSYFIDSQVFFRIFHFVYGIWQFVSELIK